MKKTYAILVSLLLLPLLAPAQSWKPAAEAAIREHRMADIHVDIVSDSGTVLEGAVLKVKMREHAFKWGTTVDIEHILGLESDGFGLDSDHPYYTHLLNFNSVTPENAGKWQFWLQPYSRSKYLEVMDWLNDRGIQNRGHTTIWPSITRWNAVPSFVVNAQAIVENGVVIKTKEEVVRDTIKAHIEAQLPILQARGVYEIDLVNELVNEGEITSLVLNLPPAERPAEHARWYQWAKAAAPEVDLIANEYNLFQSGNNFHQRFVEYIQAMQSHGAPIDGVGMQGHFFSAIPNWEELKRRLAEVAVLDLPMAVTEFDMNQNTYEAMERVMYAVFSEPLVQGFNLWGAWDGRQWRNNGAIYDDDWSVKPSGRAWFELVKKEWWTDTLATLDAPGSFQTRGFLGEYDVYLEYEGQVFARSFSLEESGANLEINIDEGGYPIPTAELAIEGDKTEVFLNEPIGLSIAATDSLESVTYFNDSQILAYKDTPPFAHAFAVTEAEVLELSAEARFATGYRLCTPVRTVTAIADNTNPHILDVFPPLGATIIDNSGIGLYVSVSDPDDDPLTAVLLDSEGEELARSDSPPFVLPLEQLEPGSNYFRLRVEDDRFGFDEWFLVYTVIEGADQNLTVSIPLDENDDVEETASGSIDLTGDLDLGEKVTGIRFPFPGIPPGAVIDSAFVQFTSQKAEQSGPTVFLIRAEKSVDPVPFTSAGFGLTQRTLTMEVIRWEPPAWQSIGDSGPGERSPDIGAVIDELISQDNWSAESPVHLIIGFEAAPSKRSAFSYDQSSVMAPALEVFYTADLGEGAPEAPREFSLARTGENSGIVSWAHPVSSDIMGYRFFFEGEEVGSILPNPSYALSGLEPEREYTVQAQAIGRFTRLSELSEPFVFRLSEATGSAGLSVEGGFRLFPNPAKGRIWLEGRNHTMEQLQLIDGQGRVVREMKFANPPAGAVSLDVSSVPAGAYVLRIGEGNMGARHLKVIIQ